MSQAPEKFQVDLTGLVNLLSHHLYSGPQVYLRELLQNGLDAITAATQVDPGVQGEIYVVVDPATHTIEVSDTGVGLSAAQARQLLATIGKSSKRDEVLGFGRAEFLGQFGIGLLATFMIADEVTVISQARGQDGSRPAPIVWIGNASGTFTVRETTAAEVPEEIRDGGSLVRLTARPDARTWVDPQVVTSLIANYGQLLPVPVWFAEKQPDQQVQWLRLSMPELPWELDDAPQQVRSSIMTQYAQQVLGFEPLAVIELRVPTLGISGAAFVLPQAVAPGSGRHTVYLKRMLLGDNIDNILPEWAFFVRAVLNTDSLSPTASREQLHDDSRTQLAKEALGEIIKTWLHEQLSELTPEVIEFLQIHNLAMRSVAAQDSEMLELIAQTLPYETTAGALTLQEARNHSAGEELLYATSLKDYKRVAAVARAAGLVVVNAGYAYDMDVLSKLQSAHGWLLREIDTADLTESLATVSLQRESATAAQLTQARQLLQQHDCDVLLRQFEPTALPAMLLQNRERDFHDLMYDEDEPDDIWGGMLQAFDAPESLQNRTLVLNDNSPVVQQLLAHHSAELFEAALTTIYLSAVSQLGDGLRGAEAEALSAALTTLLQAALPPAAGAADASVQPPRPDGDVQ